MIPLPGVRDKGCPLLGARGPGSTGPFGEWPDDDGDGQDQGEDDDQ